MGSDPFFSEFQFPTFVPPPPPPPNVNIPSIIIICILITLVFLSLNQIISKCFCCLLDDRRHDPDPESLDMLDKLMYALRRGHRQQALEKLLPLVNYRGPPSSMDCVICLEDLVDGETCRAFPVCKHVFHLNCIDIWLKNHQTCPVCRNSITDVETELQYLCI